MCNGSCIFFVQAEDGIRDLVRSRGLGDVYKRQVVRLASHSYDAFVTPPGGAEQTIGFGYAFRTEQSLSLIHI